MASYFDILAKNFDENDTIFIGENLKYVNEKAGNPFGRDFTQTKIRFKVLKKYIAERLKQQSHGDIYVCLNPVKDERLKDNAQDSFILGVDIDGVAIPEDYPPSYYWETSPDKYQGIYVFDNLLTVQEQEMLLRKLIVKYSFDPTSADVIHYYRVPNTDNFKYKSPFKVSKMQGTGACYRKTDFIKAFKDVKVIIRSALKGSGDIKLDDDLDIEDIIDKYNLHSSYEHVMGVDRSTWAWIIERLMIEQGATKQEVKFVLLNAPSEMQKFTEDKVDDEVHRAFAKIDVKDMVSLGSLSHNGETPSVSQEVLDVNIVQVDDIRDSDPEDAWLIEGLWANHSVGVVGAPSKAFKSTFVMNMACAVATGEPFDGRPVRQGGVLIVQAENSLSMEKKKIYDITGKKGLPIYFVKDRINLENTYKLKKTIKKLGITLLILDPMYLLFGSGDINKHNDVTERLKGLSRLSSKTGCSIMLVHHSRKLERGAKITTSDMYGSSFIEGWYQSMILMQRKTSNSSDVTTYFRDFKSGDRYILKVDDDMSCRLIKKMTEHDEEQEADLSSLSDNEE